MLLPLQLSQKLPEAKLPTAGVLTWPSAHSCVICVDVNGVSHMISSSKSVTASPPSNAPPTKWAAVPVPGLVQVHEHAVLVTLSAPSTYSSIVPIEGIFAHPRCQASNVTLSVLEVPGQTPPSSRALNPRLSLL